MDEREAWQQRLAQLRAEIPALLASSKGEKSGGEKLSVLYVGATPWRFQMGRELFEAGHAVTLLEAHRPFAEHYGGHPWLHDVIWGDVRDVLGITGDRRWDVTVWWHGPEHLGKEELSGVLLALETVTDRLVVLGMPWGVNLHGMVDGNPHSKHLNSLYVPDLEKLGYEAKTLGRKDDPSTWCHLLAWKRLIGLKGIESEEIELEGKEIDGPSVAVYTAIFGGYDDLPPVVFHDVPHICFTDAASGSESASLNGWRIVSVERQFRDPTRDARMYKVLPHLWLPDFKASIWVDGCVELKVHPSKMLSFVEDDPLAVFAHPSRNCVYDEAEAIIELGKWPQAQVLDQVERYGLERFPADFGLAATQVVVRRHVDEMVRFNQAWWSEICVHTGRDQLSFPFVCWKLSQPYRVIPGNIWDNDLYVWRGHASVDMSQTSMAQVSKSERL